MSDEVKTSIHNKQLKKQLKKEMDSEKLKQRMYGFVLRQLSPMEKGVQSLHSAIEYANANSDNADYRQWAENDKTLIILDAGVSSDLCECLSFFQDNGFRVSFFNEEDLDGLMTSVSVLLDERIWDTEQYPSYKEYTADKICTEPKTNEIDLRNGSIVNAVYTYIIPPTMEQWAKSIFNASVEDAERFIKVREFVFSKRVALM